VRAPDAPGNPNVVQHRRVACLPAPISWDAADNRARFAPQTQAPSLSTRIPTMALVASCGTVPDTDRTTGPMRAPTSTAETVTLAPATGRLWASGLAGHCQSRARVCLRSLFAYKLRRKSIMAALTSGARSCSVQWPQPGSRIAGRSLGTIVNCPAIDREKAAATKSRSPAM
jgi:hypothetical protein